MQLFAQGVDADFEVLDDGVALHLIVEGVFAVPLDRVFGHVEKIADARRFAALEQIFASAGHEKRLHELLGHGDVEELARLHLVPELDQAMFFAEGNVGERADGELDGGVVGAFDLTDRFQRERLDLAERFFGALFVRFCEGPLRCHVCFLIR
jgi:hypothetical protein